MPRGRTVRPERKNERKQILLTAVVEEYIRSGRPVGSFILAQGYPSVLSAPTVRNTLAELERDGFLTHPHTSAGRVPTDRGYRSYIDTLKRFWIADPIEENVTRRELAMHTDDAEDLLRSVPWMLARLSGGLAFVVTPAIRERNLRAVEVLPVGPRRALVVFVGGWGFVRHRTVFVDGSASKQDVIRRALDGLRERRIYTAGEDAVFSAPDLQEKERSAVLHLMTQKSALLELIDQGFKRDLATAQPHDVIVKVGSENKAPVFKNMSLIATPYGAEPDTAGLLGILGPRRINYSRAIGVVGFVGSMVGDMMRSLLHGFGEHERQARSTFPGTELVRAR